MYTQRNMIRQLRSHGWTLGKSTKGFHLTKKVMNREFRIEVSGFPHCIVKSLHLFILEKDKRNTNTSSNNARIRKRKAVSIALSFSSKKRYKIKGLFSTPEPTDYSRPKHSHQKYVDELIDVANSAFPNLIVPEDSIQTPR